MIQLPPKKRVPELKLKKLTVIEPAKRRRPINLPSVTTVIDGIPIIEYICDMGAEENYKRSPICLDSSDSVPPSPTGVQKYPRVEQPPADYQNSFSPEPIKTFTVNNQFEQKIFENEFHTDYMVAMKKPTRWDSGPRKTHRPDAKVHQEEQKKRIVTDTSFQLKPRDPRIKTFRKHHRSNSDSRGSFQFDDNLMDISSPEYNSASPFSPFGSPPASPKVAFDSKIAKRKTGFFDSESECSEMEYSREKSFYQVLSTSVGRPPDKGGPDQKKYFWDSSSGDESEKEDNKINISSSKEEITQKRYTIPRKAKVYFSSDDDLETKYSKIETKSRSRSTSSLKDSNKSSYFKDSRSPNEAHKFELDLPDRKDHGQRRHNVCIYCGDKGHASNDTCPLRVCSLCFKIGHNFRECTAKGKNRPPKCSRCRISCHERNRCGEIWRQCHNTTFLPNNYPQCAKRHSYNVTMDTQAFRIDQLKSNLYCCNCANYGHVFFQCDKPHPSRYFYIPVVGHHDIPLSVPFREIRDNASARRCLKSLLPKPYQVIAQNFWGDGNWNEESDHGHSSDENGFQGNWPSNRKSDSGKDKEVSRHFIETEYDTSPLKPPRHNLEVGTLVEAELQEYQKVAFNAYQLAFERANRGSSIYARDLLNNRGFLTLPPYSARPLAPLVYLPEGHSPPRDVSPPVPSKEERRSRERQKESDRKREDKRRESHASFSQTPTYKKHYNNNNKLNNNNNKLNNNNNKFIKHSKYEKHSYKLKHRNLKIRPREKQKFDLLQKHIRDARDCINRNRTKRNQREIRISRDDDVTGTKSRSSPAQKRHYSPKHKEHTPDTPELKIEQVLNIDSDSLYSGEETYMFIDEVN